MTFAFLALGLLLMLFLLVWASAVKAAGPSEFKRDQYSAERAARLAWIQRSWKSSRQADTARMRRVA